MIKTFEEALHYRRAIRNYDATKPIDTAIVKKCIEQATLAPSSSNMQLYEFHHIISKETNQKLAEFCFDQGAAKTAQEMVVFVVRKDLWKERAQSNLQFLKSIFGNKLAAQYSKREKFAINYYQKLIPLTYFDFFGILGNLKFAIYWIIGLFRPIYREARSKDIRVVAHKSAALAAQTFMIGMAVEGYDTCPMEGIDSLRIKKLLKLPAGAEINMVISCGIRKSEGVTGPRFRIPFDKVYKQW
ncbi:MAG TPA: nitroreductase family protein [Flavobacteriaceae bacterium]|jgi:nitroreductase|nr:nitroreductase family protein [Flavobacteriaceae bacterium]HEX5742457.1 nitroreductase family protein [Flavobacteriaceae bacterium]